MKKKILSQKELFANLMNQQNVISESEKGQLTGGFTSLSNSFSQFAGSNQSTCDNTKTCSGTNSGVCDNSGDCADATNPIGATCTNSGTCFAF